MPLESQRLARVLPFASAENLFHDEHVSTTLLSRKRSFPQASHRMDDGAHLATHRADARSLKDCVTDIREALAILYAACQDLRIRRLITAAQVAAEELGDYWLYPSRYKATELWELCNLLFEAVQQRRHDCVMFVCANQQEVDGAQFTRELAVIRDTLGCIMSALALHRVRGDSLFVNESRAL